MSTLFGGVRAAAVVALTAALSTTFAGAAHAEPSPGSSESSTTITKADPEVVFDYTAEQRQHVGDRVTLQESGKGTLPAGVTVSRRINWGDGSAIDVETSGDHWSHAYTKVGVYHFTVEVQAEGVKTSVTYANGNAVTIDNLPAAGSPTASYHLVPNRVHVNEPVKLTESELSGEDGPGVYIQRFVKWGDGTPEEAFSLLDPVKPHKYAKAGTYHVSVRLTNPFGENPGAFPDGNTVSVTAAATGNGDSAGGDGNGGPVAGSDGSGGGESLPVTGPGVGLIGGAGLALIAAGAVAFVLLRRRRIRFTG